MYFKQKSFRSADTFQNRFLWVSLCVSFWTVHKYTVIYWTYKIYFSTTLSHSNINLFYYYNNKHAYICWHHFPLHSSTAQHTQKHTHVVVISLRGARQISSARKPFFHKSWHECMEHVIEWGTASWRIKTLYWLPNKSMRSVWLHSFVTFIWSAALSFG